MKLYVHSLVDKLKWFYENARCYNKIYYYYIQEITCQLEAINKKTRKQMLQISPTDT